MASPQAIAIAPRNGIERLGEAIAALCLAVAGAALGSIVVINAANVVGRYAFSAPLPWAEEAMLYLMVLTILAGSVTAGWRGAHIGIDALVVRLPRPARRAAALSVVAVAAGVLLTVAVAGGQVVALLFAFDQRSDALDLPMWIPQSVVVGGLALTAAMMLLRQIARVEAEGHG